MSSIQVIGTDGAVRVEVWQKDPTTQREQRLVSLELDEEESLVEPIWTGRYLLIKGNE